MTRSMSIIETDVPKKFTRQRVQCISLYKMKSEERDVFRTSSKQQVHTLLLWGKTAVPMFI